MRIARLIERLPPATGGKEIHGARVSWALARLGVEQHVFCRVAAPLGTGIRQSVIGRGMASQGHRLVSWCAGAARAIERAHRDQPFDLIHAHGDFIEALAAAATARRLGIPAVLTVHGGLSDVWWHDELRVVSFSAMEQVIAVSDAGSRWLQQLDKQPMHEPPPTSRKYDVWLTSLSYNQVRLSLGAYLGALD
jgi:hypothetical protein